MYGGWGASRVHSSLRSFQVSISSFSFSFKISFQVFFLALEKQQSSRPVWPHRWLRSRWWWSPDVTKLATADAHKHTGLLSTAAFPHRTKVRPKGRRQTDSGQHARLRRRGGEARRGGRGGFSMRPRLKIWKGQRPSSGWIQEHQFVLQEIKNTNKIVLSAGQGQENVLCCILLFFFALFFSEPMCHVITVSYINSHHCYFQLMLLHCTLLFIHNSFNKMINSYFFPFYRSMSFLVQHCHPKMTAKQNGSNEVHSGQCNILIYYLKSMTIKSVHSVSHLAYYQSLNSHVHYTNRPQRDDD